MEKNASGEEEVFMLEADDFLCLFEVLMEGRKSAASFLTFEACI